MSNQPQRAPRTSPGASKARWANQGQPWRQEPEISADRQQQLDQWRRQPPNILSNTYPFKGQKLTRADVEWLLATHESGGVFGPIDWSSKKHRQRMGLDLRGADLKGVKLKGLPLAGLRGGLTAEELDREGVTAVHKNAAAIKLGKADLREALLQGAVLTEADLVGAKLQGAHLDGAYCFRTHLDGANLTNTHFEHANLRAAAFDSQSVLTNTKFDGAFLLNVLWDAKGKMANLAGADWGTIARLGEEEVAREKKGTNDTRKTRDDRLVDYDAAVGANSQLAEVLRSQGVSGVPDRFAYRAEILQRQMLFLRGKFWNWLGSLTLDALAGYGYRPFRLAIFYVELLLAYAMLYFGLSQIPGDTLRPLGLGESVVVSLQVVLGHNLPDSGSLLDPINIIADTEILVSLALGFIFANLISRRFFNR